MKQHLSILILLGFLSFFTSPLFAGGGEGDPPTEGNESSGRNRNIINLKSNARLIIGAQLNLLGTGNTDFSYRVDQQAPGAEQNAFLAREWSANQTVFSFQAEFAYAFRNLNVGFYAGIERIKNSAEKSLYFAPPDQGPPFELKRFQGTEGAWPTSRFAYGPFVAYDIQISKNFYITPNYRYLFYNFNDDPFLENQLFVEPGATFNDLFTDRYIHEYGARFKFGVGGKSLMYLEVKYSDINFTINEDIILEEISDVETNSSMITIGFGYHFLLLN